tara:strand:+ start:7204 stop:8445 length:1242 start_codon:yes stop_codon:yes gene_type:complete
MLPKGWKLQTVDDLFHVQLGKMLNQAAKEKNPHYKYLGNSNVRWGYFETNNLKTMYFSERELGKFALQKGDIILCEGGEVGRCAIWDQDESDIFYQKALHRLRSKGNIDPEYFQSFMYFINGSKLLDDFTTKTSIAHLTREKLLKLPVKTPPLPEQRKIAEILSTWDKAIATTEKLIAASQQQKKALMQQLLTGKKRFAGFSEEWEEVILRDCVSLMRSGLSRKLEIENVGIAVIRSNNMGPKFTTNTDLKYWYLNDPQGAKVENYILENGDILVNFINSLSQIGKTCIYRKTNSLDAIYTTNILRVKAKESVITPDFLYYLTKTEQYQNSVQSITKPAVNQASFTTKEFGDIGFSIPKLPEQQKIAAVLTAADQEIDALQSKLAHLKQEKKALMQQLLTGKRRVVLEAETSL